MRVTAGGEGVKHLEKLAPVALRAGHLLAVNLRTARASKLLKLGVKSLAVGADAGIAEMAKVSTSAPTDLGGKKPTLYRHPTAEH